MAFYNLLHRNVVVSRRKVLLEQRTNSGNPLKITKDVFWRHHRTLVELLLLIFLPLKKKEGFNDIFKHTAIIIHKVLIIWSVLRANVRQVFLSTVSLLISGVHVGLGNVIHKPSVRVLLLGPSISLHDQSWCRIVHWNVVVRVTLLFWSNKLLLVVCQVVIIVVDHGQSCAF